MFGSKDNKKDLTFNDILRLYFLILLFKKLYISYLYSNGLQCTLFDECI